MKMRLLGWLAVAAVVAAPLGALSYVHVDDSDLAAQADLIVRVEVAASRVDTAGDQIRTLYTMWVDDLVKGDLERAQLTVQVPGGRSDRLGVELRYDGAPAFATEERALLFLKALDDGTFTVLHFVLGAFWERTVNGVPVFVRDLPEPEESSLAPLKVGREAGRFIDWLRDESAGRHRGADYLVALEDEQLENDLKFTTFVPLQAWQQFQQEPRSQLTWARHKTGQQGVKKGGKKEIKKTFNVFKKTRDSNGQSGTVDMKLKGTFGNSAIPPINTSCLAQNVIIFADASATINSPYSCAAGGILAVAGACRSNSAVGKWKGRNVHAAASGRLIYNANTACFYQQAAKAAPDTGSSRFATVTLHEFLHTLGLGHACGDDKSPACRTSDVLNDATMRALAHTDGRGAEMREDDLAGFLFLYDEDFLAAPCHLPPGHKKFCQKCGPCGPDQGACKKDKQCFAGLECKPTAGERFKTCQ